MARCVKKLVSRVLNKCRFELEALEPRCLLSGGVAAVVASPLVAHALLVATEAQTQTGPTGQSQNSGAYDPVAQVGSILPDSPQSTATPAVPVAPASNPANDSPSTTGTQNQQAPAPTQTATANQASAPANPANVAGAATTLTGSSQVAGSPATQQLTETLTAANGPPASQIGLTPEPAAVSGSLATGNAKPKDSTSTDLYTNYLKQDVYTGGPFSNLTLDGVFQLGPVTLSSSDNGATIQVSSPSGSLAIGSSVTGAYTNFACTYTKGSLEMVVTLGSLDLSISSFINLHTGSVTLTLNESPTQITLSDGKTTRNVTSMTLNVTGATLFAGLNGPAPGAIGVTLAGVNVELAVLQSREGYTYYGLDSGAGSVTGLLSGLSLTSTNLSFQVNASTDPNSLVANFTSPSLSSLGLTFDAPLLEAAGTVTLGIGSGTSNFITLSGSMEIGTVTVSASVPQVTLNGNSLAGTQILTIGGTGVNAFVGINGGTGNATGLELNGVSLGLAMFSYGSKTYWGLDSTATTAALVGLPSALTFSASSLTVQVNQSTDTTGPGGAMVVADFSALTVATVALTDLTTSNGAMEEFGGTVTLGLGSFVTLTGSVAVEAESVPSGEVTLSGGTPDSTMLTIGGTGLKVFAGLDGAIVPGATAAPFFTGKGVELDGVSFGLALVQDGSGNAYWGLESQAGSAELVGLPGAFTLSASSLMVKMNQGSNGMTANFAALPVSEGGNRTGAMSLTLSGQIAEATGTVTLSLDGFLVVMGTVAVESQSVSGQVTLSDGALDSTMLTIGGTGLSVFAGINGAPVTSATPLTTGPYFTGTGVELDGVSFGLAMVTSGSKSYWGLEGTGTTLMFDGLPSAWRGTVNTLSVKLNQSTDTSGPGNSMVAADFSSLAVPTGGSAPATVSLSDLTGPSALLEASGMVDLNIGGGLLVHGTITVTSQSVPTGLQTTDGVAVTSGTMLIIAATNLDVFAGINGVWDSTTMHFTSTPQSSIIGLEADGVNLGLVFIQTGGFHYWAATSYQTGAAMFDGLPPSVLTVTATNLTVEVNQSDNFNGPNNSMVVVDFSKLPASSGGAGGSLSIAGTVGTGGNPLTVSFMQQMLEASAKVSLTLGSNVIVSGTMAVSSQTVSGGLTLSNGQTLDGPMQQDGIDRKSVV